MKRGKLGSYIYINHYLLKTANAFDRILRAKGTLSQKHLLEFIQDKKREGWQGIWSVNSVAHQIAGPKWAVASGRHYAQWATRKQGCPSGLAKVEIRRRITECYMDEENCKDRSTKIEQEKGSIFCAQAQEIDESATGPDKSQLVFQRIPLKS